MYFCFPGLIGATCSLYVEFCFFNFSNAENPGKDLLHPSETTTTEEKRQSTDDPESKAKFLGFKVKTNFQVVRSRCFLILHSLSIDS